MPEYAEITIRKALPQDAGSIWATIGPAICAGETYALPQDLSETAALDYWMGLDRETFVAEIDGQVVGTYYLRPNQLGRGAHVCNCGFMTATEAMGQGVARAMCAHSLDHARFRGFRAMQFNFVVSTNERAIRLWQSMGFSVVGTLPGAFDHPSFSYVDAMVMYRNL